MAYGNYGAFVRKDGVRREDKEDVVLFDDLCHGVLGDGDIRVKCYKIVPSIWERQPNGVLNQIPISQNPFEYKDYHFEFKSGKPNVAIMIEPSVTKWECTYGFEYGSGWSEE